MFEEKKLQEELELGRKLEKEFEENEREKIEEGKAAYEAKVAKAIAKFPERKEKSKYRKGYYKHSDNQAYTSCTSYF